MNRSQSEQSRNSEDTSGAGPSGSSIHVEESESFVSTDTNLGDDSLDASPGFTLDQDSWETSPAMGELHLRGVEWGSIPALPPLSQLPPLLPLSTDLPVNMLGRSARSTNSSDQDLTPLSDSIVTPASLPESLTSSSELSLLNGPNAMSNLKSSENQGEASQDTDSQDFNFQDFLNFN